MLSSAGAAYADSIDAQITVLSTTPARVRVVGERSRASRVWSFRNIYAGVMNLGERIESLVLSDRAGQNISVRKLAPGEYEAAGPAARFTYEMKLEAPAFAGDAAHVSWLTGERGLLMLGDLLPLQAGERSSVNSPSSIRFVLPADWKLVANSGSMNGRFELSDSESAVFFVGRSLREKRERLGSLEFTFVTAGDWAFSDEDATDLAINILKEHVRTFGGAGQRRVTLVLSPFPLAVGPDRWSAETRGGTVTLLIGKSPSKTAALAQLSFPLAHELFHLWVPNSLALDGNYGWFYEGFTLYQALRAGVTLELLTFRDYLNAIGRAFDAYKSAQGRDELSLLAASERRWTASPALIYNKGMVAAFLYDLNLQYKTKGKSSLRDVYRQLFRLHGLTGARSDGNAAALSALNDNGEMGSVTRRYIESAGMFDLPAEIAPFGLLADSMGARTRISVAERLTGAQRDLLRRFGYNEKLDGAPRRGTARPR